MMSLKRIDRRENMAEFQQMIATSIAEAQSVGY
jgi:hypothetical protein